MIKHAIFIFILLYVSLISKTYQFYHWAVTPARNSCTATPGFIDSFLSIVVCWATDFPLCTSRVRLWLDVINGDVSLPSPVQNDILSSKASSCHEMGGDKTRPLMETIQRDDKSLIMLHHHGQGVSDPTCQT